MKNGMKQVCLLALAGALALGLSACGGGDATGEVEAAQRKLQGVNSFVSTYYSKTQYVTDGEDGAQTPGETVNEMELTMILAPEPEAKLVLGDGSGDRSVTTYVVKEDGAYVQYLGGAGTWLKAAGSGESLGEMGVEDGIALFLNEGTSYRRAGTEALAGGKAVKYTGVVRGEALVRMLDEGNLLPHEVYGMSEEQQEKIKKDLLKLKGQEIAVWVDEATGYPVQYEMDLGKTVQDMYSQVSRTLGGYDVSGGNTVTGMVVRTNYSRLDGVAEITLPPEAAQAQVVS